MEQFGLCYSSLKHALPSNIKTSACLANFKARLDTVLSDVLAA